MNTHTEAEAKEKSCPMAVGKCLGAGCMAWRWAEPAPHRKTVHAANEMATTEPLIRPPFVGSTWEWCPADYEPACWVEPESEAIARRSGFCGLAGTQHTTNKETA